MALLREGILFVLKNTVHQKLFAGLSWHFVSFPSTDTFEPIYSQLQSMKLDKSPFVIISVIGQELLAAGYHASSLVVLESALKIGERNIMKVKSLCGSLPFLYIFWSHVT